MKIHSQINDHFQNMLSVAGSFMKIEGVVNLKSQSNVPFYF